jgi:hypothetical protein
MKSLKQAASEESKLSFDLSRGDLIRLKSPRKAKEPEDEAKMVSKELRNPAFKSCRQGP